MSSLKDYLASKYLADSNSDKKKKKKKKKAKDKDNGTSLKTVVDDDADDTLISSEAKKKDGSVMTFEEFSSQKRKFGDEEDEEIEHMSIERKKRTWKKLDGSVREEGEAEEEAKNKTTSIPKYYGLQTADQVAAHLEEKEAAEAAIISSLKPPASASGNESRAHDTVYRDAQGRRIEDPKALQTISREQARQEALEKERIRRDINTGIVQQKQSKEAKEARKRLRESEENVYTRSKDDKELNARLKRKVDKFHDPAAVFLRESGKRHDDVDDDTELQIYGGAYGPNRFNIPPGSMWDGVDRSNGFEELWFRKDTEIKEKKMREYEMSYDI